jgi:hypothetical protein
MNPYLVAFLPHAAVLVIGYLLGHRRRGVLRAMYYEEQMI